MFDAPQRHRLAAQALAGGRVVAGGLAGRLTVINQGIAQDLHRVFLPAVVLHAPNRPHCTTAEPGNQRVAADFLACFEIQRVQIAHSPNPSDTKVQACRTRHDTSAGHAREACRLCTRNDRMGRRGTTGHIF